MDLNGSSAPFAAGGETGVEADRFAARTGPSILWLATDRNFGDSVLNLVSELG